MPDRNFVKACLKSLLGDDTSEDIIDYVLTIESEEDFTEFMQDIITNTNPEHKLIFQKLRNNLFSTSTKLPDSTNSSNNKFVKSSEVVKKTQSKSTPKVDKPKQQEIKKIAPPKEQIVQEVPNKIEPQYDTDEINQNDIENIETIIKTAQERSIYRDDDFFKKFEAKPEVLEISFNDIEEYEKYLKQTVAETENISGYNESGDVDDETEEQISEKSGEKKRKKKTKFVNLFDADNKTILQKGRHPCQCQATVHALINNCLSCGRIVCEQEGSGPCFFCDEMVCTQEEEDILASDTKTSHKLYNTLMDQKTSKEWKKAIELRNKLVSIDRLGDGKNIIYDDQSDYFDLNNKWNSEEEKRRVEKRRMDFYNTLHKPISEKKTTLNISGEGVSYTSDTSYEEFEKNMLEKITRANETVNAIFKQPQISSNIPKKGDVELNDINKRWSDDYMKKAQAKLLSEKDNGSCLSMHQPYASLLIAGIKKHEGRSWSTNHRGPLWIASTAKFADEFDIAECEEMYKVLYNDENLDFPKMYPPGCLLGCVYIEDCMPQNEYRKKYPDGESESPFVFICSHPVALPVFIPVFGKHKIYQLDKGLHQKAKAGLKAAFKIK